MAEETLAERYSEQISGVLNCYDRIVISGSVHPWCYAKGMTGFLYRQGIKIFDYTKFVEPMRATIRQTMINVAQQHGLETIHVKTKHERKEEIVAKVLKQRGHEAGLVCILSAMEQCGAYEPWHDKVSHKTAVRHTTAKCLHYYVYFIDADIGLGYMRVPTWCPFRLQVYLNGHTWLARQLDKKKIGYEMSDNAFVQIDDFERANELAAAQSVERLHARLEGYAKQFCPVIQQFGLSVNWSIMQAEYATDIVFKQREDLAAFYPTLLETLIHAVKPADIAMFLGKKPSGLRRRFSGEVSSLLSPVREMGTRIKHRMGPASIKMYDKFAQVLRIETTINDVTFFDQYRKVRHTDGSVSTRYAPMKKSIYSLDPLRAIMQAANRRYLGLISTFERRGADERQLAKLTETVQDKDNQHRYKGFNPLAPVDAHILRTLVHGEFTLSGFTARNLRPLLPQLSPGQLSRLLKRLRVHGLIRKIGKRYKYYLSDFGRRVSAMALSLRELHVIPALSKTLA